MSSSAFRHLFPLLFLLSFLAFPIHAQPPIPTQPQGFLLSGNASLAAPIQLEIFVDLLCPDSAAAWVTQNNKQNSFQHNTKTHNTRTHTHTRWTHRNSMGRTPQLDDSALETYLDRICVCPRSLFFFFGFDCP